MNWLGRQDTFQLVTITDEFCCWLKGVSGEIGSINIEDSYFQKFAFEYSPHSHCHSIRITFPVMEWNIRLLSFTGSWIRKSAAAAAAVANLSVVNLICSVIHSPAVKCYFWTNFNSTLLFLVLLPSWIVRPSISPLLKGRSEGRWWR